MKRLFGLILLLVMSVLSIQAQDDPLLIVMNGQLYRWSGDATQAVTLYADCTPSERIVSDISVNNAGEIAFLTEPIPVSEAMEMFGGIGGGPLPTNVRVCDGASLTSIAGQPDDFSFFDADMPDVAVTRSTPTWSPDGSAIAWTAFDLASGALTLNIYNPDGDGSTATPLELPEFAGVPSPPYITWQEAGIYLFHSTLDQETFAFVEFVYLYDATGKLIAEAQLPATDETRFVYDKFIVMDNDKEYVGLLYNDGIWELVDPMTGGVQPANGVGELYSKSGNSDISLLLTLDESQQYIWTAKNSAGIIIDVNGNNVAVPGVFPTSTDLSDGGQWVFQLFDGLYFWSMTASGYIDGTEPVTTGFSATAWGDLGWRIYRDA